MLSLTSVVFLGKLLISKELGVHAFAAHVLAALRFFDTVGVSLVCAIVSTSVLLLWFVEERENEEKLCM